MKFPQSHDGKSIDHNIDISEGGSRREKRLVPHLKGFETLTGCLSQSPGILLLFRCSDLYCKIKLLNTTLAFSILHLLSLVKPGSIRSITRNDLKCVYNGPAAKQLFCMVSRQ